MGSLFHLLDINEDTMAKKTFTCTSHVDGLEAPRNSLELPVETSYGLYTGRENMLHAYHVTKESSENNCRSTEAPIKELIRDEISDEVACLMGFDTLPCDSEPVLQLVEVKSETPEGNLLGKEHSKKRSVVCVPSTLQSPQPLDYGSVDHGNKPQRREHPQEEELQKFKKEFEAWQAKRLKESSKIVDFSSAPSQLLAQENLNREKMFLYANSNRVKSTEREPMDVEVVTDQNEMLSSCNWEKEMISDQTPDIVSASTKIVTLRPGPNEIGISENSWNGTPSSSFEKRGSIENFLQEVKERLNSEMQGKSCKRSTSFRGGGIETPYREKPSEPRQITQHIAQQVRDSVTRDLGMNLPRSESTRSCKSDSQLHGTASSELFDKVSRRFLTERLRNVLKGETHREAPMVSCNSSRSSVLDYEKGRDEQIIDLRIDPEGGMLHEEMSPTNLIRSMSAPVSGTSLRNLLIENRSLLAGEKIGKKHEVVEKVSMNVKKHRKDKFNIREKVSSFRYSLTHRGRLFRWRVQSVEGSHQNKLDLMKDISSGPTGLMRFFETQENFTEVPPSPASVCSSVHEEFRRSADYSSPASPSCLRQMEDNEMPHDFRVLNSNSNEAITERQPCEVEIYKEDQTEAYIRDLLVASGLYYGSCDRSLLKWDPLGEPISSQVFEVVEESYRQTTKNNKRYEKEHGENLNHKMLLDLLNEALLDILKPKAIGTAHTPLRGKKLFIRVWEIIRIYVHPPVDRFYYALDNMLSRDFKFNPWFRFMDDDINALGKDIESLIIEELIDDIVKDMQ